MKEDLAKKVYGGGLIYFLSWHDALERLDTLILEIRHLQTSIISYLREPVFYLPLRFEEKYLWGENWLTEAENELNIQKSSIKDLVELWMMHYPAVADFEGINSSTNPAQPDESEKIKIEKKIQKKLYAVWVSVNWNRDQRRYYHTLWGLQQLKRRIFKDKLFLCKFALKLSIHKRSTEDEILLHKQKAKLLIVRAGVMRNLQQYILLLRNFQNDFNKSMDTSIQDHLRPSIERRREMGMYMDFLSERSKDILRDMHLLLTYLGANKKYSHTRIIFHRWRHHYTSTTESLDIDYPFQPKEEKCIPSSIRFVNTSYFMPERPDLQPVIAHEVAHALLRDKMDNLDGVSLAATNDQFSRLIARIQGTLSNFEDFAALPTTDIAPLELSREIACDLLATSVKGYSYIYALFLDLVGIGTEKLLAGRNKDNLIELSNIEEIHGGPAIAALSRNWLLRIKIATNWISRCHHTDNKGELGEHLEEGIGAVLNDLNNYLDSLIVDADLSRGLMWGILIKRLEEVINDSKVWGEVKKWRAQRSTDDTLLPSDEKEEQNPRRGKRKLPRSMVRLPKEVRNKLFYLQFNKKLERTGKSGEYDETWEKPFENYYGVIELGDRHAYKKEDSKKESKTIFRHLYDISWQAGLMRAMDFHGGIDNSDNFKENSQPNKIIYDLHHNFFLGRAFFFYALEFYSWLSEPAIARLQYAVEVVNNEGIKKFPHDDQKFREWLGEIPDSEKLKKDKEHLRSFYKSLFRALNKDQFSVFEKILMLFKRKNKDDYSALNLISLYQNIDPLDTQLYRAVERRAGNKIEELCKLIEEKSNPEFKEQFHEFHLYLKIRSNKNKEHFLSTMTSELANCDPNAIKKGDLITVTLNRIASYSPYRNSSLSLPLIFTPIQTPPPLTLFPKKWDMREVLISDNYWSVLGKYNGITIKADRPIPRSRLPYFPTQSNKYYKNKIYNEFFPSFFARQEMALFGCFRNKFKSVKEYFETNTPLAFCAITLQKRQYRLDFLYRLIQSEKNVVCPQINTQLLSTTAHCAIRETDAYFLTDGWGDLVIVFSNSKAKIDSDRLEQIYEFYCSITQDFMVDRVDLILTPQLFNLAVVQNLLSKIKGEEAKWTTSIQIKLLPHTSTNLIYDKFKSFFINVKKAPTPALSKILSYIDIELFHPPGKTDFVFEIITKDNIDRVDFEAYQTTLEKRAFALILKLIHSHLLDRIETVISKKLKKP